MSTGKTLVVEPGRGGGALRVVEFSVVEDEDALGAQLVEQPQPDLARLAHELVGPAATGVELLARRHAVGRDLGDAGLDLLPQAGHTDHEELAQVRAQDREELDALEERVGRIASLVEDALEELEQAEFAIDVEQGVRQVLDGGLVAHAHGGDGPGRFRTGLSCRPHHRPGLA